MSGASAAWRGRWLIGLGLMMAVAASVNLLALWLLPQLIMQRAMAAIAGPQPPAAVLSPMTDHRQRRIVMPSPDLAYAVCVWDLSQRPLRVRAHPVQARHYWSLALYDSHSDNFHVLNDRQAHGHPVDWLLVGPVTPAPGDEAAGAQVIRTPSDKGLLLMRVLVADRLTEAAAAQAARQTLRCESLAIPGG